MKNIFKFLALVLVVGFISCTDNTENLVENEKQELQSINKEDSTTELGNGPEEPDMDED